MIQTSSQALRIAVDSTTVSVSPGTVRIGTDIIPFRGGSVDFGQMTSLSEGYRQYSALALIAQPGANGFVDADMTSAYSGEAADKMNLLYPRFDTSNFCPLGLFLFSYDGTTITLEESSEVVR